MKRMEKFEKSAFRGRRRPRSRRRRKQETKKKRKETVEKGKYMKKEKQRNIVKKIRKLLESEKSYNRNLKKARTRRRRNSIRREKTEK